MPFEGVLHLLAEIFLEFLFYFLFYGAVTVILCFTSSRKENVMEKGYDIKI